MKGILQKGEAMIRLQQTIQYPVYNCFICINKSPSVEVKATKQGFYPNLWQEFYYCDECKESYIEMHSAYKDLNPPQQRGRNEL